MRITWCCNKDYIWPFPSIFEHQHCGVNGRPSFIPLSPFDSEAPTSHFLNSLAQSQGHFYGKETISFQHLPTGSPAKVI